MEPFLCPGLGEREREMMFVKIHCAFLTCLTRVWATSRCSSQLLIFEPCQHCLLLGVQVAIYPFSNISQNCFAGNFTGCFRLSQFDVYSFHAWLANCQFLFFHGQNSSGVDIDEEDKFFLNSDLENNRRDKFKALIKLQEEHNGLVEPRRNLAIQPGMYLPENVMRPSTSIETDNGQSVDGALSVNMEVTSDCSPNRDATRKHRNPDSRRKSRFQGSSKPMHKGPSSRKQWIKKEPQKNLSIQFFSSFFRGRG